jgi:ATP-dependent RNA helicase HelY
VKKQNHIEEARERFLAGIRVPEASKFEVDDFQREAISRVANNEDTLVVAPTGAGKTYIALEAIRLVLSLNLRAVYTTPLKALSNTKFNELKKIFEPQYQVGLLTGDRKIDGDAGVVIATTEIYRNELYKTHERYSLVVLDEVHFIADPQRGPVWEESIILTPSSTTLLMLSASISNAEEIAAWISEVRGKPCRIVVKKERPVELRYGFLHPDLGVIPLKDEHGGVFREVSNYYGHLGLDSSGMRLNERGLRGKPWNNNRGNRGRRRRGGR